MPTIAQIEARVEAVAKRLAQLAGKDPELRDDTAPVPWGSLAGNRRRLARNAYAKRWNTTHAEAPFFGEVWWRYVDAAREVLAAERAGGGRGQVL